MNLLVVVLLTVLWASILVPGAVRGRHHRSPISSVSSFERSMGILAAEHRSRFAPGAPLGRQVMVVRDPRQVVAPSGRSRTLARRRMVLQGLGGTVAATGLLALALGGTAVVLFALAAVTLAAYVGLLLHVKASAAQTRRTVRRLPVARAPRTPERQRVAAGAEQ